MSECERCGDSLQDPRDKDNRGWWRDKCYPCIEEVADSIDRSDELDVDWENYNR